MKIRSDTLSNHLICTFVIGFKSKNVKRELKSRKYTDLPDYDLLLSNCKNHLYKTEDLTKPLRVKTENEYYYANNKIDNEFLIAAFKTLDNHSNVFFLQDERKINLLAEIIKDNELRTGQSIKSEKEYIIMARKYMLEALHVDPNERIALAAKMKESFIRKMRPYSYISYFPLSGSATPLEQILQDFKYTEMWFIH